MRAVRFFFDLKFKGVSCGYFYNMRKLEFRFATICDKYSPARYVREISEVGYSKDVTFLGDDPNGRDCIIIDDFIDTVYSSKSKIHSIDEANTCGRRLSQRERCTASIYCSNTWTFDKQGTESNRTLSSHRSCSYQYDSICNSSS